jgi:hypothetical protein
MFNIHKFRVLTVECLYMFRTYLRINIDYFCIQN